MGTDGAAGVQQSTLYLCFRTRCARNCQIAGFTQRSSTPIQTPCIFGVVGLFYIACSPYFPNFWRRIWKNFCRIWPLYYGPNSSVKPAVSSPCKGKLSPFTSVLCTFIVVLEGTYKTTCHPLSSMRIAALYRKRHVALLSRAYI
ncbi:hypothetical protein M501DRAFT_317534 [Patellaria atrata CBS 101060]|uniref:Uncharacterized protein n=1 Tax=Patellaria atrata CBS 101060 TaxID=1346257 RepID=A0A9P4VPL1_9PEZI|nr:hypothetical protein M501DRAFT_317534 [Patellaria atrata CBS 101060]